MLRVIQAGTGRPISYPVDPNATFQPGMIGQIKVIGNDIVMGVSDGMAPFGIIDDVKDTAFSRPQIAEVVIIEPDVVNFDGYNYTAAFDTIKDLRNSQLVPGSFRSEHPSIVSLNEVNGIIKIRAGTVMNYTAIGSTTPNAFRTKVWYAYYVANMPGEDTTFGSGRMTIWFTAGIFQTDQYELVPYAVNANLYVSANGKLTSEQSLPNQPCIGMVIVPPTSSNTVLEFKFFG